LEGEPLVFGEVAFFGDPGTFVVRFPVWLVRTLTFFRPRTAGADPGTTAKAGTAA
jgi:hypothetical protein